MKKFKIDFVSFLVGVVIVGILFAVGFTSTCNNPARAATDEGVVTIRATEKSYYVIDSRFNLCFYHTKNDTIPIPCNNFNIIK